MPDKRDSVNPAVAWDRFKTGSGTTHDLTVRIAKTIFEQRHRNKIWENAAKNDQWLAVGSWMAAEAVVKVLPLAVAHA